MKRCRKDAGFAMLMVFLLSACIAITLYVEIPRVAFEAERQRELLLVDRGNQFKRSIQVFVTDKVNNPTHRYPATIDELESFNNHRYLRHRYIDPMTGKDEWRLVHINGGILTDSVTTQAKPGGPGQNTSTESTYLSQQSAMTEVGAGGNAGSGGVQRALNRRPSDTEGAPGSQGGPGGAPGALGDTANGQPPAVPGIPNIPGGPGQVPAGLNGQPGGPQSGGQQQAQQPCNVYIGSCAPTSPTGGLPGQLQGQQAGGNPAGMPPAGLPGSPGFGNNPGGPGFNTPGGPSSAAQQSAASMISDLLTKPRPGGMPPNMPGSTIGGGLAGVASKYEAEGIMVINQRTKINEWEYIFDMNKYRAPPNPVGGAVGNPQQPVQGNAPGQTTQGPAGPGSGSGTGTGLGTGIGKQ